MNRITFTWWQGGILAGVLSALAFGGLMSIISPQFIETTIPALYGFEPNTLRGMLIHLFHGAVLGLIFAAIVSRTPVMAYVTAGPTLYRVGYRAKTVMLVIVFGLFVWGLLPVIVMPIWLGEVGAVGPQVPFIAVESLVGHVLYGALLGLVYAVVVIR